MSWLDHILQRIHPEEFQISPPRPLSNIQSELQQLMKVISELPTTEPGERTSDSTDKANHKFLADLATRLWRLRNQMTKPNSNEALPGMERTFRFFESAWDALARENIDIIDHTNEIFDPGIPLEVLSYEKRDGLVREIIIETVKPTIFYMDQRIQNGQVLVGIPHSDEQ